MQNYRTLLGIHSKIWRFFYHCFKQVFVNILYTIYIQKRGPRLFSLVYVISISQEVCRHMDSVFKELLARQAVQDPPSINSSPSAQSAQRKGRWDGRRGRGTGVLKAADAMD